MGGERARERWSGGAGARCGAGAGGADSSSSSSSSSSLFLQWKIVQAARTTDADGGRAGADSHDGSPRTHAQAARQVAMETECSRATRSLLLMLTTRTTTTTMMLSTSAPSPLPRSLSNLAWPGPTHQIYLQGSALRWSLGCVNPASWRGVDRW